MASRHGNILKRSHTCLRIETVRALHDMLEEFRVVHVRGTPASGKTTLADLLESYYKNLGDTVIMVPPWERNPILPIQRLIEIGKGQGCRLSHTLREWNVVLIFDEAQISFHDKQLWLNIIKTQSGSSEGPRICIFSSYGSPSTGPVDYPLGSTPVRFAPGQQVSTIPSPNLPSSPHLFYT